MNVDREVRYYQLLEQLLSLTQIVNQKPDVPQIEAVLNEIAAMFRLAKGVTRFFRNPGDEKNDVGERMSSFDTGKECVPVHTVRFVSRFMSITTMTIYMEESETPLTQEEMFKVDLVMRTTLAFISRNRLQVIAEELAFYDDLGFRNIRSFFKYLSWKNRPGDMDGMAALHYNMRHFGLVNDEFGRIGGDEVLRNHYRHIEALIGEDGAIARLGGDAFCCVCAQSDLPEILEYLHEASVPISTGGKMAKVSARAGVFMVPDGFTVNSPDDIMTKIMSSFHVAKTGDQGDIVFYSEMLMSAREKANRIMKMFPIALKDEEFHVYYQPKVNLVTGEICGAEALCRWFHEGKIVPPTEFIPILEECDDICKLDFHILDQVCRHIRKWLDEGRRAVRVSVNLSRRHIVNPELAKTLIDIIDRNGVPHEYIEIELTETTTDVGFRDLKRVVEELQKKHICTSVDDFGMGYSSLNLIRVIPWDVLKIDKNFLPLDEEADDSVRSIMCKYVIAMAKDMGLECIVEGVETPAQLKRLRENGCDEAQGYLFDKPMPLEEFEKRLDMVKYEIPE
ncbi:MAG: EAL domain-containing protein [Lachnospiraceae bacterium]|nr:EAL domain-containing protein [Lachnospiraceae bacterium]